VQGLTRISDVWLRNCVYKRVAKPGKKPGFKSTMLTFMTSAFWHGVAPGYYRECSRDRSLESSADSAMPVTFVLGGLAQSVGRTLRKHLRPIVFRDPRAPNPSFGTLFTYTPAQLVYCGLSIVAVQLSVNFTVLPFMLLGVRDSLAGWHALGYYGLVVVVALMAAFRAGLGVHLDRASGVAQQKKADKKLAGLSEQGKANMQMPDVVSSLASEAKKEL
jgi:lysophospholipid acyltransferase